MSFSVLFRDELAGMYRSKAILALLVGLPVMMVIVYLMSPGTGGMPLTAFSALIASTLAGTLAAVLTVVGIINEKNRKVYDLFLVRPGKSANIMLAKFTAVFLFVSLAVCLSIGVGMATDVVQGNAITGAGLEVLGRSLSMSISTVAVASAVGVLIGAAVSSLLVGVILVLYGGNQLVGVLTLLSMNSSDSLAMQVLPAVVISIILLFAAVEVFKRKSR